MAILASSLRLSECFGRSAQHRFGRFDHYVQCPFLPPCERRDKGNRPVSRLQQCLPRFCSLSATTYASSADPYVEPYWCLLSFSGHPRNAERPPDRFTKISTVQPSCFQGAVRPFLYSWSRVLYVLAP